MKDGPLPGHWSILVALPSVRMVNPLLVAMARAIPEYIEWMQSHTKTPWFSPEEIDIKLVDVFDDYFIDKQFNQVTEGGRLIKAWFKTRLEATYTGRR